MIVARTPSHISFAEDGSDLPAFYERHGAVVFWIVFTLGRFTPYMPIWANKREMAG